MDSLDKVMVGCGVTISAVIVIALILMIIGFTDDTPLCRHGWQYDRVHGKQILNEHGGGIRCSAQ